MGYMESREKLSSETISKLKGKIGGMGRAFSKLQKEYNALDEVYQENVVNFNGMAVTLQNAKNTIAEQVEHINKLYVSIDEEKKYAIKDPELVAEVNKLTVEIRRLRACVQDLNKEALATSQKLDCAKINKERSDAHYAQLKGRYVVLSEKNEENIRHINVLKEAIASNDTSPKNLYEKSIEVLHKDVEDLRARNGELSARNCQLFVENKKLKSIMENDPFGLGDLEANGINMAMAVVGTCLTQELENTIKELDKANNTIKEFKKDDDSLINELRLSGGRYRTTISKLKEELLFLKKNNQKQDESLHDKDNEIARLQEELHTLSHNHKRPQPSIWDYERELLRINKRNDEDVIVRLVHSMYGYYIDARIWMDERPTTRGICLSKDHFFTMIKEMKGSRKLVEQLIEENEGRKF